MLGGPGPSPSKPIPSRLWISCVCGERTAFDPQAPLGAWWMEEDRVAYLAADPGPLGRRDPQQWSWDLTCDGCGAPMRLLFDVGEWGKMGTYFPAIHTVVELEP